MALPRQFLYIRLLLTMKVMILIIIIMIMIIILIKHYVVGITRFNSLVRKERPLVNCIFCIFIYL
jgi:hypothetical protein